MTSFTFRSLARDDFPLLAEWLSHPHVHRWWAHEWSPDALERDFGPTIDGKEPAEDFIASMDGEPIGVVQYCHIVDYDEYVAELAPVYRIGEGTASIDYFIGDLDRVGCGIGTMMLTAFVDEMVWARDPRATQLVVPVNAANTASNRVLEKVGFTLVAVGEMEPDNPIDDHLHHVHRLDRPALG
jgi:aminoglycoside 6'-N-acetyltransferase